MRDLACIWHPFTQAYSAPAPIPIFKGEGAYLYSETGEAYLDAISSWWVNLHGHAHPYIAERIAQQARELEHVMFAGFTHPQAILFAERLLACLPSGYSRVFYSDNGSTAVEAALKIALQASGAGKKILSFTGAYHGDTFGAMAAAGKNRFNRPFWPYFFEIHSIEPPTPGREEFSWRAFEKILDGEDVGVFIFEPLIQGAGGMRLHSAKVLSQMIAMCRDRGICTIGDEVMTGFGRTGSLFACDRLDLAPDILCLSKGITGGFLPLGATVVRETLFASFLSPDFDKAFLHGHSYTANPIVCAAANASLDLLLSEESACARNRIACAHQEFQKRWGSSSKLLRCDVLGTILALEYRPEENLSEKLSLLFREKKILVRPLQNVLYFMPPYCVSSEDLNKIYEVITMTLA